MNTVKVAFKILKTQKRMALIYLGIMFFTMLTVFVFFNVVENPALHKVASTVLVFTINEIGDYEMSAVNTADLTSAHIQDGGSMYTLISTVILVFSIAMAYYVNRLFYVVHSRNYAILKSCGTTLGQIRKIMMIMFMPLYIVAAIAAMALGTFIFVPIINSLIFNALNITDAAKSVNQVGIFGAIEVYLGLLITVLFENMYKIDSVTINSLLDSDKMSSTIKRKHLIQFVPGFVYVVIYAFFIYLYYQSKISVVYFIVFATIALIGVSYDFIPSVITLIRKQFLMKQAGFYVSTTNLNYDLRKSMLLSIILAIGTILISVMIAAFKLVTVEVLIFYAALIIVVVLTNIGIVSQFIAQLDKKIAPYRSLICIGFSRKELRNIVTFETISFFVIQTFLSYSFVIFAIGKNYLMGSLDGKSLLTISLIFLIPLFISSIVCLCSYLQIAKKEFNKAS